MNVLGHWRREWQALARKLRCTIPAVLASALAAGCDHPFNAFQEHETAVFSMFGYLDLKADTQWVRVMPIRQSLLLDPEPIDATVTLEHLGSGRTVALRDSLFRFTDRRLDTVAYAHNFWTTEPLEPGATYRLSAVRSDGASTTATVVMPADFEISFRNGPGIGTDHALLLLRAEKLLLVEVVFAMSTVNGDRSQSIPIREYYIYPTADPGIQGVALNGDTLERAGLRDARRQEIRLAVAGSDWPYHPKLSDLDVALPGRIPSTVENGVGFVGGVAKWTIPFHRCQVLAERPDGEPPCVTILDSQSAYISGMVIRQSCGEPDVLSDIRLTERFVGGGAAIRSWKTGWDGRYWFEGIEPGADLTLDRGPGTPAVPLPKLAAGERYAVADLFSQVAC